MWFGLLAGCCVDSAESRCISPGACWGQHATLIILYPDDEGEALIEAEFRLTLETDCGSVVQTKILINIFYSRDKLSHNQLWKMFRINTQLTSTVSSTSGQF